MNTIRFPLVSALTLSLAFTNSVAVADDEGDDEHHILDELIVTATPLQRTVEQLAQPTSVLGAEALAKRQQASIGETLADELGVSASYFGPVSSRPVIRGQFGERVRVLTDGLDSLDASALSEDHAVSVDSILADRVEIVRGPATLLYGSGASGGLVNVVDSRIAENPLDRAFSGALALNGDTALGRRSGAFKLDFGNDGFAGHIDWFRRDTDNIEIPGFAESRILRELEEHEHEEGEEEEEEEEEAFGSVENTDSETEGGAAAFALTSDAGFLGVSVSSYDSNYGIPGHGHGHEEEEGGAEEEEESVRIDLDQVRYDIKGQYAMDGFLQRAKLRVARNDYEHVELEGDEVGTRFDNSGTDARLELRHRSIGNLEGAFGLQYKNIDFEAEGDEAFVPSSETSQLSLFVFEEYAIRDTWVLQASARIENQDIETPLQPDYDETALGASIGSIWSLGPDYTLSANLAVTERQPNSTELFADGPHIAVQRYERGSVTQGSGFFDKEQSTNLDLTLRRAGDRFEWTVTAFLNDIDDYILLSPTSLELDELQVFDYEQQDVEMYGVEAEALVDIFQNGNGHLHARLFTDFVHGEEKSSGEYLPRLPPLRWGVGLHYTRDRFDASIDSTFHSKQDKLAANELPTGSFSMLDVEASYKFDQPDLLVFIRGTNLSDEDARRHTSPLKDLVPLPGRSVQAGLRWNF